MHPSFSSLEEEVKYWSQLATQLEEKVLETQERHDEFIQESKLLEEELEKEAERAEEAAKTAKRLADSYLRDRDQWKEKFHEEKRENEKTLSKMQSALEKVRAERDVLRTRTRDLEQQNDDLERHEREITTSLQDLEIKLTSAMERTALLESEIETNANLSEEIQRLRDELRDQSHELAVLKSREQRNGACVTNDVGVELERRVVVQKSDASTNTFSSSLHESASYIGTLRSPRRNTIEGENPFRSYSFPSSSSTATTAMTTFQHSVNFGIPLTSKTTAALSPGFGVGKIGGSRVTNSPTPTKNNNNNANNPVNMVREMLGRVKMLESRLISCRSLVTPLLTPSPRRRQARRDSAASDTTTGVSHGSQSLNSSGLAYMTLAAVNDANVSSGNSGGNDGGAVDGSSVEEILKEPTRDERTRDGDEGRENGSKAEDGSDGQ